MPVRASTVTSLRPTEEEDDAAAHTTTSSFVSARSAGPKQSASISRGLMGRGGARPSILIGALESPSQSRLAVLGQHRDAAWLSASSSVPDNASASGEDSSVRPSSDHSERRSTTKHSLRSRSSTARGSMLSDRVAMARGASRSQSQQLPAGEPATARERCRERLLRLPLALRRRAVPHCRALIKTKAFQVTMFVALMSALFLPDFWVLIDRPDSSDLDVLLTFVLVLFVSELVVQSIGLTRTYWGSFFFWMDLLGAASLLLDISYMQIPLVNVGPGDISNNVVITRMARVAKLGARAGRFTKLVKLLRFLPGIREKGADLGTAKLISNRLTTLLSTRVSCLIILMVMILPLFSIWTYPEQDWSMKAWLEILEGLSRVEDVQFQEQLEAFHNFYSDFGYYPFRVDAKAGLGLANASAGLLPWTSERGPPKRRTSVAHYETASLVCDFSFKQPTQMTSVMNVVLMVFIMVLMVAFSLVLSNSVSAIVLRPLEKLLMQVRTMATKIFQSVTSMATMLEDRESDAREEDENNSDAGARGTTAFGWETALLEKVVQKLTILSEITMNRSVFDAETMAALGEGDRAVIQNFGLNGGGLPGVHVACRRSMSSLDLDATEEDGRDETLAAQNAMIESAGLTPDLLNSWNINPLELDRARNRAAVTYCLGPHNHGIKFDAAVMGHFLEAAEAGYNKSVAYHNWYHAVDVTHCVYRLLQLCGTEAYLSSAERYGLLVSATCHDVGHPGLNNIFLVEASYELALRYNDKSPLENMHCARLFEIVGATRCNIFATLSQHQFQEVRKCCIESILHTDNVHHFPMIKEVQMLYEVHSEQLDAGRASFAKDEQFPSVDVVEVFRTLEYRRLLVRLLLHFADISNCSKPFRICRIWAQRVLEEFFSQGDEELKAGLPVQALNDREKVNRPFSQVGFIEFLVSPLQFAVVKVLPPLLPLLEQLVQNTKAWHQLWLGEAKPPPGEAERQGLAERIAKLEKRYLDCQLAP